MVEILLLMRIKCCTKRKVSIKHQTMITESMKRTKLQEVANKNIKIIIAWNCFLKNYWK